MKGVLTIGRLAAETQVPADTIRYYEAVGLLPPAARSAAGFRLYGRAEVRRLQLIKRAKLLGLSLDEIKTLVDQTFTGSCAHLQEELLQRIPVQLAEIERRLGELQALKADLCALQGQLASLDVAEGGAVVAECEYCAVIEGTAGNGSAARVTSVRPVPVAKYAKEEAHHDPGTETSLGSGTAISNG
jgi:DNA-binding transcriptional MerR regulator